MGLKKSLFKKRLNKKVMSAKQSVAKFRKRLQSGFMTPVKGSVSKLRKSYLAHTAQSKKRMVINHVTKSSSKKKSLRMFKSSGKKRRLTTPTHFGLRSDKRSQLSKRRREEREKRRKEKILFEK